MTARLDRPKGATRALVIVPTYNERENLPTLVDKLLQHPDVAVMVVVIAIVGLFTLMPLARALGRSETVPKATAVT